MLTLLFVMQMIVPVPFVPGSTSLEVLFWQGLGPHRDIVHELRVPLSEFECGHTPLRWHTGAPFMTPQVLGYFDGTSNCYRTVDVPVRTLGGEVAARFWIGEEPQPFGPVFPIRMRDLNLRLVPQ